MHRLAADLLLSAALFPLAAAAQDEHETINGAYCFFNNARFSIGAEICMTPNRAATCRSSKDALPAGADANAAIKSSEARAWWLVTDAPRCKDRSPDLD